MQFSTTVRNARGDAVETSIGTSPLLIFYSGAKPANCAASDPSGEIGSITLPSNWLATAAGGLKGIAGTWAGAMTTGGTIASFRIKNSAGSVCHVQGTVTLIAASPLGDMIIDDISPLTGQVVNVTQFDMLEGNA